MKVLKIEVKADFLGTKETTGQEIVERFVRLAIMNAMGLKKKKGTIKNMLGEEIVKFKMITKEVK